MKEWIIDTINLFLIALIVCQIYQGVMRPFLTPEPIMRSIHDTP